jgi:hypothetical protein
VAEKFELGTFRRGMTMQLTMRKQLRKLIADEHCKDCKLKENRRP